MQLTLDVPSGHMVFATIGACASPIVRARPAAVKPLAAVSALTPSVSAVVTATRASGAISGATRNAKPTARAVKSSARPKLVFLSGSTAWIRSVEIKLASRAAAVRAEFQVVKNALMAEADGLC